MAGRPISSEYRETVNKNYDAIWKDVKAGFSGMGFVEGGVSALSVSDEERNRLYEECWQTGNGFRFNLGGSSTISQPTERRTRQPASSCATRPSHGGSGMVLNVQ